MSSHSATAGADIWTTERRDALVVAGPDAASYLHSQVSQDITALEVGASAWTLVLEPTGKVEVLARVWRNGDTSFVLDTDVGFGDLLEGRVRRFMIRVDVAVDRHEMVVTSGPTAADEDLRGEAGRVVGWWGRDTVRLGPTAVVPPGATAGDDDDVRAARVRAGWPAMGHEIEPGVRIPAEIGVVPAAVNLTKGCYPGQELVERMDSRGAEAPRRLCQLDIDADAKPGDAIIADGQEVGSLTSVAGTLALGYVKRSASVGRPVVELGSPAG